MGGRGQNRLIFENLCVMYFERPFESVFFE